MYSTQISTTCCRSITKLVVSIGSGLVEIQQQKNDFVLYNFKSLSETQINYADASARSFYTNPSWLTIRGGLKDLREISEPAGEDYLKQATAFLERHFGRKPTVRASQASHQRLVSLQLNALETNSDGNVEEEEQQQQQVVWHSCLLEEVTLPPSQYAGIIEWIPPETESLRISNRSWHLENCMAWRLIVSHRNDQAKCYCQRIKQFMDKVNTLVDLEMEVAESSGDFSSLSPMLTDLMLTSDEVLKKLNDLLDLQDKRNQRYERQLKYES